MARPKRCRKISSYPKCWKFLSEDMDGQAPLILTLDEYEVIHLIDYRGYSQEECATSMGVARTTVTAIYSRARRKIADFIVNGRELIISGGSYTLDGKDSSGSLPMEKKKEDMMRIAVAYKDGSVFQHFGKTEEFKIYQVADEKVSEEKIVNTNGKGHGALAGFLKEAQVDALICGGIGGGAKAALGEIGIKIYPGVQGKADEAVQELLRGDLKFNEDLECSHHGHHHEHGGNHSCGSHCGQ